MGVNVAEVLALLDTLDDAEVLQLVDAHVLQLVDIGVLADVLRLVDADVLADVLQLVVGGAVYSSAPISGGSDLESASKSSVTPSIVVPCWINADPEHRCRSSAFSVTDVKFAVEYAMFLRSTSDADASLVASWSPPFAAVP